MKELRLPLEQMKFVFSPYEQPAARIKSGDAVRVHTLDCFCGQVTAEDQDPKTRYTFSNPMVGPIAVEGAMPGDALRVEILSIVPGETAVSYIQREFGAIQTNRRVKMLNEPLPIRVYLYRREGGEYVHESGLRFAADPFIGTIGTAPLLAAPTANTPFDQGGNMDVPDVKSGNILYLPVRREGGYLYLGDCHARQGQGEACGAALEVAAQVDLRISVLKGKELRQPRIESDTHLMCVGSARPMEDAARIAVYELVAWMAELGWDTYDAYQAVTQDSELYVGNMVDPNFSLVAKVKKSLALHPPRGPQPL